MNNLKSIKNIIEKNPLTLATITKNNKPNIIAVAYAKVIKENQIIVTNNFMNQTIKDILQNKNICLLVWNQNLTAYKLVATVKYFTTGKWKKYVEDMKENQDLKPKGALLIKVTKIIKSK